MELQNVTEKKVFTFKGKEITGGKKVSPLRGIIYGDNGIGKTTFAASAKNPIIMDMEGNCGHIDAPSLRIEYFTDFMGLINELIRQDSDYNTLVIDSLDSLQAMLAENISQKYTSQELGFGGSSAIWATEIKEITGKLEKLSSLRRMNILFTAHWRVKAANNPMTEQYDRYDLRINEQMRTGFCNWVQFIVLATKEVLFEGKKDVGFGKKKAKNIEKRVIHTRGAPTYYGKNVFNLPPVIDMDWGQFIANINNFYGIKKENQECH